MTRVYLFVMILSLHCALGFPQEEPSRASLRGMTWLMQGDTITQEEATSLHIRLITQESNLSVSDNTDVRFARTGYVISCVIAASVHGNGHVSVAEGGYGSKEVRVLYVTDNGKPDVLHVFIQAVRREVVVDGNVAESARQSIVYEPMRNWTLDDEMAPL